MHSDEVKLKCAACNSPDVYRKTVDGITLHPGFRCHTCGCRMRGQGMTTIYALAIVLGVSLIALMVFAICNGSLRRGRASNTIGLGVVGLVVIGSAIIQLRRPMPRQDPPPV